MSFGLLLLIAAVASFRPSAAGADEPPAGSAPAGSAPAARLVPAAPLPPLEPLPGSVPGAAPSGEGRGDGVPAVEVPPAAEPPEPDTGAAPAVGVVELEPGEAGDCADAAGRACGPSPTGQVPAEPDSSPPPAVLTPSQAKTLAFQMKSYLRQLHERVSRAWAAPVTATRGPRRVTLVTVVIARNGTVVDARVDRPSIDEGFDRSALRALRRPFLFPPLPPYYRDEVLEVDLRFADPRRPAPRR